MSVFQKQKSPTFQRKLNVRLGFRVRFSQLNQWKRLWGKVVNNGTVFPCEKARKIGIWQRLNFAIFPYGKDCMVIPI
jgi:hypothetical protein